MFYDITNTAFMTTDLLLMTSHPVFRISHHYMYDIESTVSDLMSTVYVSSHKWHTHLYWCIAISMISQVCKSSHLAHVWHHTNLHHITFTHYDLKDHVLWFHKHCIHDIRSPLYDITSTLLDITPLYVWHQVHCTWHHVHWICVITPTLSMASHPLYGWYHIQYICDIISPIFMT